MTLERILAFTLLPLVWPMFSSWGDQDSLRYNPGWLTKNSADFVSHAGEKYLAMNLAGEPAARLRQGVESRLGKSLKNRDEAHVTVITPPEFAFLSTKLSGADLDRIAQEKKIQKTLLAAVCVGRGETKLNGNLEQTYFVVVKADGLREIRKAVAKEFTARGGAGGFDPNDYFPHVTLGFTARDLHESDGVKKDEKSCVYSLYGS